MLKSLALLVTVPLLLVTPEGAAGESRSALPALPASAAGSLCGAGCLSPVEAVTYADAIGTKAGVSGNFRLEVRAVGNSEGRTFLNSEADYRDRNCLTIAVPEAIMSRVLKDHGFASAEAFRGKQIVVSGTARKVRIDFVGANGKPSGKYYYQIHVRVRDKKQIKIQA